MNDPTMRLGVRNAFAKSILLIRTLVKDDATALFRWKRGHDSIVEYLRFVETLVDQNSFWIRAMNDFYAARPEFIIVPQRPSQTAGGKTISPYIPSTRKKRKIGEHVFDAATLVIERLDSKMAAKPNGAPGDSELDAYIATFFD